MADPVTVAVARVQAIDAFNVEAHRLAKSLSIDPPPAPQGLFAKDPDLRSLHWTREAGAFLKRVNDKLDGGDGSSDQAPAKAGKKK